MQREIPSPENKANELINNFITKQKILTTNMQREIKPLEEFEAQPLGENIYDSKELLLQDIIEKINEIIEHLNNN